MNASHCIVYLILKLTTVYKHEYYKMTRTRETRIRTFRQLEIEACLEEISWMIRCHNCEAINCPQEEYPARLVPTPPPSYIDNLQSRLIKARKGIFPASLKLILKTRCPLPVRRPAPETSVQPDDVIGEHRAEENIPSSQCHPSPRRGAVDMGSEEPGTPPRSPAISTGSGPGVSRAETQIMEEEDIFPFETSMDGFLRSNFTSTEQECALLHQPDVGVDVDEKETTTSSQQACTSSTTGRGTDRERCKESASVIGGTGRRSATSAQSGNPREPGFYWRSLEAPSQVNASHCIVYLILKLTTVYKHEYYKMTRTREARIRTFRQLELEACLEEVSWMIRCHNCEALNCPQEEYSARLVPNPPPSYIDNLQSRLIKARKGIFPASLKMILKTRCPLPVRRPAPDTSVQLDDVIGEHRAGENSPSSQCHPSPRRGAVDMGSEEPRTPPRSPAISTGSGPGVSRAETQIMEEEERFPFETSIDGFLRSNFTSTEQECALLHQPDVGVDDDKKQTTATSQQDAVHEEFVSPTEKRQQQGRQLGLSSRTSNLTGASHCGTLTFLKREIFACVLSCLFFPLVFFCLLPIAYFSRLVHKKIAEAGTKGDMSYLDAPDA